jgi:hypothetical protein
VLFIYFIILLFSETEETEDERSETEDEEERSTDDSDIHKRSEESVDLDLLALLAKRVV